MNYSVLESSCQPKTIAYTSNKKFFPLCTPIYTQKYNYVMRCPGPNNNNIDEQRSTIHKLRHDHLEENEQTSSNQCNNCNQYNFVV